MRPRRGWVVAALIATGCEPAAVPPVPVGPVIRDSAGIRIVEHTAAAAGASPGWTLGTAPALSLGTVDGDPAHELFGVEDALRLDDGTILVANGGASEVRLFRRDGAHLAT